MENKTNQQKIQSLYNLLDAWADVQKNFPNEFCINSLVFIVSKKIEELEELEDYKQQMKKFLQGAE